ncbi:hypothetical protein I5R65_22145 [Herbaspirillum sp. AP02]|uniref:hypothetical protein n=1 Tax=unclassified Herbaspirillum TaxID=2624150 RepID=UPI0015DA70DE|nr:MULTISPECIES: hypothetical protein [unclassified Herbaspirillum]MBG7622184.1 hypothetical protein [Herbaspirillum sp. AP02]NZD69203.1 hypothetical protein [Herbaspirillum sp. AP21]
MDWIDAIMQYAIYAALALCMGGLVAAIVLFIALERRWQERVAEDVEELAIRVQSEHARDGLPLHPWEELRNRIGEMQIVAEESDRPIPYKNVA